MDQEYVYGFFADNGDGKEMLFTYGVYLTEEEAWNAFDEIGFGSHVEVEQIKINR